MKFHLLNLYIWLSNGKRRKIEFQPNKVNIITGDSLTGKTAILDIFDYCLFASKHTISEASINERATWYGLRFYIQGKTYTIARRAPKEGAVSDDYFFSSVGETPEEAPSATTSGAALKKALSADFSIDQDAKVSFGGSMIKAGSRISLRYFLLFNTISQDIIANSTVYFDKQGDSRYREALPRTFDLAVGVDTVSNILRREKRLELEKKLKRLIRQEERISKKSELFREQITEMTRKSKEFGLLEEDAILEASLATLKDMIAREEAVEKDASSVEYDRISSEINKISLKIRNLRNFSSEYEKYKKSLSATSDSLKTIDFLSQNYTDLVRTSIFSDLMGALADDQLKIKREIANKTPLDSNVTELVKNLEASRAELRSQIEGFPQGAETFRDEREKYIFLGETRAKLDLYTDQRDSSPEGAQSEISSLEEQIASQEIQSVAELRSLFVTVMNETTQNYVEKTAAALGDYANYRTYFDYKEKRLFLKKPKSLFIENVGSSSNDMFLHLFMFLGLHEVIISNNIPHVPPFLVIDQFSRPYWGDKEAKKDKIDSPDVIKVKCALELLNGFVGDVLLSGNEFQMIVFEHIPEEYWSGMTNVHLVEKFEDGNALVPDDMF